jgi:hypothetical protein
MNYITYILFLERLFQITLTIFNVSISNAVTLGLAASCDELQQEGFCLSLSKQVHPKRHYDRHTSEISLLSELKRFDSLV